jgi:chaperonin GroEL
LCESNLITMNQTGYTPKELHFSDEGREKLFKGLEKITNAVKSTLGPQGNTVLIESQEHTHGMTVTKDGVTVAKSIALLDPVENLAVRIMKEASEKTAVSAGDGTTTAIVLSNALVRAGEKLIESKHNKTAVLREMVDLTNVVVGKLKKMSKPVTDKKLASVATISANNDPAVGKIIADVYKEVGSNGIVTVERSQTAQTYYETTKGIKVDRGYTSNLFINNHKKDECILEDTYVLVSDAEISNVLQIENVLKPIISNNSKLLIIAPCSTNVVNTLAANVMKNGLKICVIQPPNFGYKQHELMNDIALSVGATYYSEKTGDDLSLITSDDLGKAKKVIVGRNQTIVIKDDEVVSEESIKERVEQLQDAHELSMSKDEKEFILSRIASLTGGIGVIYVGGNTDLEQKELHDRVDDAVCAVRSATVEGILPGAGMSLAYIAENIDLKHEWGADKFSAYEILKIALKAPAQTILENAGLDYYEMYGEDKLKKGYGHDVKNGKYGNLISMGVIDPMKVTKSALQNAVSVAVTLLSTNAIVTMARSYETK